MTLSTLAQASRPTQRTQGTERTNGTLRIARGGRIAVILAGVLGLSAFAAQGSLTPTAHAATGLHYQRGYSVQQGWLCYGWSNGGYHCTRHWTRSGGRLISLSPSWVPNYGSTVRSTHTTVHSTHSLGGGGGGPVGGAISATPGGISQWAYTGHPAYAMSDFRGDPNSAFFGACTWYAWYRHQNEPLMRLGMAYQWASRAPAFGLRVGSYPAVGATAVFQPGVQGASGGGHAAHVEAVYGGGWFLVSEMSFYWNGGGWGRVSYRYAHTGAGVAFIY